MKKSSRQLILGSLQPFLFCVGMYFVVLIFSVFICSSIYKTMHGSRGSLTSIKSQDRQLIAGNTAMITTVK
jgi:hypothetical protein